MKEVIGFKVCAVSEVKEFLEGAISHKLRELEAKNASRGLIAEFIQFKREIEEMPRCEAIKYYS